MRILVLSLALAASKIELEEDPIEVRAPRLSGKDDEAITDALAVIQKPASQAQLHEALQACVLLGVDVGRAMAAAKGGAADSLDARLLAIADAYLGFGDWAQAEKALGAVRPTASVYERLGRTLRAQKRFADAAKAYVAALEATSGPELDDIVRRIVPALNEWVQDYEAGRASLMRDSAKQVLTAMLPHQAGDGAEATKKLLARLAAGGSTRSSLTAPRLRDAIAVQVPALRACYARALVHEPDLKGRLVASFSVDETGKVSAVRTGTNATGSKALASCVELRFKALHLVTDTAVEVIYPLLFTPL